MNWDFDALWNKAKYYFRKGLAEPRDSQDFGLFCALALEFLGRASLAKIHPVLLADPQDGSNIMAVFGFTKPDKTPKSIPVKTVFGRCSTIVSDFTPDDEKFSIAFCELRNAELHSGEVPFADYGTAKWLALYYAIANKLCIHSGTTLDVFVGDPAEVASAREMIAAADESAKKAAYDLVSVAKKTFDGFSGADQTARIDAQGALQTPVRAIRRPCPSCGSAAVVTGRNIKSTPPRLVGDEVQTEEIYLPDSLTCGACGLTLSSHATLHAVGEGGQYNVEFAEDAGDYYQRLYGPEYDYDDYGND